MDIVKYIKNLETNLLKAIMAMLDSGLSIEEVIVKLDLDKDFSKKFNVIEVFNLRQKYNKEGQ